MRGAGAEEMEENLGASQAITLGATKSGRLDDELPCP